jgi:hypothetical protein
MSRRLQRSPTGVDADAKVLDEKADKIEPHGSETAKLFKTRYLEPAA